MRNLLLFCFFSSLFIFPIFVSAQKTASIPCEKEITIPTYFTPNIDGIPETFRAHFTGAIPIEYSFDIFDTTGFLVFTTSDPMEGWNGRYYNHGPGMADGKYTWKISYKYNSEEELTSCNGSVKCVGIRNLAFDTKDLHSCSTIYIPNAVTPNCDAFDCTFHPYFYCPPVSYEMWIFDRWGNMVFHTHEYQKGWDGKSEVTHEMVQEDTYSVKIKCVFFPNDSKHEYNTKLNVIF